MPSCQRSLSHFETRMLVGKGTCGTPIRRGCTAPALRAGDALQARQALSARVSRAEHWRHTGETSIVERPRYKGEAAIKPRLPAIPLRLSDA